MKNLLSTALFGVIFLGLAALAFLSAPRGASEVAASTAPETTSAVVAGSASNTLLATDSINWIALPLDSSASFATFNAAGLASYIGPETTAIIEWDVTIPGFKTHTVGSPFNNFALTTGGAYLIKVDSSADPVLTFVGDVPDQGTIDFTLEKGATPATCKITSISIPLDKSAITNASGLATDIGGLNKVITWDTSIPGFKTHTVGSPFNNFAVQIGYPYLVCANSTAPAVWP